MARTEQQIITDMGTAPAGLTFESSGDAAKWRNIVAASIRNFELLMDNHIVALTDVLRNNRYGSLSWYRTMAQLYQHGDSLSYDANEVPYYAIVDPTKRIVAAVSAREAPMLNTMGVLVKVSRVDSNVLAPLTSQQLSGIKAYFNILRPFGIQVDVISTQPDVISIRVDVYLDSLIASDTVKSSIISILRQFRDEFVFDGVAKKSDIIKLLADVNGVYAVGDMTYRRKSYYDTSYVDVVNAQLDSGYFNYGDMVVSLIDRNNQAVQTITEADV
jgi:hypothetical protein